ncbi:MAG: acyl-CoA thioesterase [Candidatus Obscuribacterales bacterium]|nr:acyl-CoA thioesterase [Candidatus Obscuribacterales bacterium]
MSVEQRGTVSDTDPSAYKQWSTINLRYGDTDRQGHINNAVYCTLYESGRVDFLFSTDGDSVAGAGTAFVIAKLALDYLKEMHFPGDVKVGSKILSIGRSSFRVGQAIFYKDQCCSTAESVIVVIDPDTNKSIPIPDTLRRVLEKIL